MRPPVGRSTLVGLVGQSTVSMEQASRGPFNPVEPRGSTHIGKKDGQDPSNDGVARALVLHINIVA